MTDAQLDLTGQAHTIVHGRELTPRQQLALDYVTEHAPATADEIGALLHQERLQRRGRGHSADSRCKWCGDEGTQMLRRLRELGLVRHAKHLGWYVAGHTRPRASNSNPDGRIPY